MSDKKMSQENIAYALGQLAGFEPSDIERDDFDIDVNDDQFATMSIVRLAALAAESQDDLIRESGGLSETVKKLLIENLDKAKDNDRMVEEIAELKVDSLELIKAIKFLYKNTKHINELQSKNIESMIEYHEAKLNKND